eukprot:TRINITY_DN6284_c0_g1_i6.p1 TRINITY_DN6284_c0_g1~~TRINITY_DN6284_c0_g1_i6.p1  ORF type:complete len:186 (+),score=50.58 TRINITY_DN6284_c0_g1_i6:94-651(+)
MPIDYSKFNNIEDSDDEAQAAAEKKARAAGQARAAAAAEAAKNAKAMATPPAKLPEEHTRPLDEAPEIELPDGPWLKYYTENMTAPQRMQTLVHLWNSAEQPERVIFLRHLIDIVNNPQVSNRIKGGQEILKDLDEKYYHGVTYPTKWVEHFKEKLAVDDKKVVFEKLFKTLDSQEQGVVLGTLM